MSAFIVSKAHIDAMIQAGLAKRYTLHWLVPAPSNPEDYQRGEPWGPTAVDTARQRSRELTRETADRVGAMLWNANRASVDHRYDEANDREVYVYRYCAELPGSAVAILKAIACYEYQSCEHPEWEASEAKAFCEALRHSAINRLPGYDEAAWEIEAPAVVRARRETEVAAVVVVAPEPKKAKRAALTISTTTAPASTIREGDVILPPAREISLWMRRQLEEKGWPDTALALTVTKVRDGMPDKGGPWLVLTCTQTAEWGTDRAFTFKARPVTPWPIIRRA